MKHRHGTNFLGVFAIVLIGLGNGLKENCLEKKFDYEQSTEMFNVLL